MSLATPDIRVQKLQSSLQAKAKTEPTYRFYSLWDKICRPDVMEEAYQRCRENDGSPGVDGITFEQIEVEGQQQWLESVRQELKDGTYRPKPLLRVWIPKSNGGRRPLGIPCIHDRIVMMATVLVIGPIFDADLLDNQYGFRPKLNAKMAVRRVFWHIKDRGRSEVFTRLLHVDSTRAADAMPDTADLRRTTSLDHQKLVDGSGGRTERKADDTDGRRARKFKKGTPQGSPLSPLLANIYFRRFLLVWRDHGHQEQLDAHVFNYADDLVICCRPGQAEMAMKRMTVLVNRLGLEVNETKTASHGCRRSDSRSSATQSGGSTERADKPSSARVRPRKRSRDCSDESTNARRHSGTRTHRRTASSAAFFAAGAATSTKELS
ncbi:reverse transcriptase domain-containing protein [Bradyrhizobium sp. ISRA443]|uniref:reverse transcriptase domain-containing protein n=1 Tax=unclassified Bradyrhizobium TaxID=2631580 RepID=UPI0024792B3D|nr:MULTISPECIES: reverse transcriptase domain-containing protein [unclassified Bradyrhizobium]WGS02795.1 reverse transcriptase domain-containing protein [Bradyrhizobium sp. ISRA436]WGS02802.1 reverse transcriptase domain-containing protein [Bradyrhizobium sp. ISRA436]WGS11700.1 reverse transcriptase domain-containing protein [Bradyrhizobium sp. ISRA443]WGS11763.1 reverse transcriptase domain-containing protein [Bradyrhizobium sp. ISRA443]